MPHKYSGRVAIILVVLALALLAIFWPSVVNPREVAMNPNLTVFEKTNIRPGIDIVGGTSLLYEIRQPEGAPIVNLAEEVMKALKKRVDPQGVMNLIWRPQGANRLEIQMPLTAAVGESAKRQKEMEEARTALERTNVSVADLTDALDGKGGHTRAEFEQALANAPPSRKAVLAELVAAHDALAKARQEGDVSAGAAAQQRYDQLQQQLAETNLTPADLDKLLALKASKDQALADLRARYAQYPERLTALNRYIAAGDALNKGQGLESAGDLKRLLRGSGVLEFHFLTHPTLGTISAEEYQRMRQSLEKNGPRVRAGDEYKWFEVDRKDEFPQMTVLHSDRYYILASLKRSESLDKATGPWQLAKAYPTSDSSGMGVVGFQFDLPGGSYFATLTGKQNVGKLMAIMLDGKVISAPRIISPITGGSGIITGGEGGFSNAERDYLIRMLSAGSLPAQLDEEPIRERTVGPQLGEDNLRAGLVACAIALALVGSFMIAYYYISGVVAFFAVSLNLLIILGAMSAFGATFTLPGIAAVVLTVGTSVDANVLIFERLREEQQRGLSLRMALRNAFDRAFSAIFDSNMTTLITSLFLIVFGTEEVKGFGIALIIGIVASLFTALFVTKTCFGLMVDKLGIKKLSSLPMTFPRWGRLLHPNINWMRVIWPAVGFSVIVIAVGGTLFVRYIARGQMFDVEFASGTVITFEVNRPARQEEVRDWLGEAARANPRVLPEPSVVRIGDDGTVWEMTTPNPDTAAVRKALISVLGKGAGGKGVLLAEEPSRFQGSDQPISEVMDAAVVPITAETIDDAGKWPRGIIPGEARRYNGGAAIVLRNLDPPLTARQITDRIKRQSLQAHTAQAMTLPDFTVVTPGAAPEQSANLAVVLTSDPAIPIDKDREKWAGELVAPMWKVINEAISKPAELRQVTSIDRSVASDTQRNAIIALVASILVIMAYIWIRFGNLKYGTATVVALTHDVLFTLAGLGLAHLLSGTVIGNVLQLQPFRINVTVMAGVLTVIGFSMLDTIVVFDRIRELRGKYGHLDSVVINEAINQTLSRTLLTSGTTLISIGVMYFVGGPGIHGFTFILLVGILVGTYSSIAIASPILLLGRERTGEARRGDRPVGQLPRTAGA